MFLSETAERYVRDLRDPVAIWAKFKEVFSKVGFVGGRGYKQAFATRQGC